MTEEVKILRSIITETLIRVESELDFAEREGTPFKAEYWSDCRAKIIDHLKEADKVKG